MIVGYNNKSYQVEKMNIYVFNTKDQLCKELTTRGQRWKAFFLVKKLFKM